MFGYIKIHKDELKIKEYDMFKAYYCGLCFALKKNFGNIPRMTLSYDAAFLALLLSSLYDMPDSIRPKKCISNPLKKRPVLDSSAILDYASAVNVILVHYKLKDDLTDGFSVKALGLSPLFYPSVRKAKRLNRDIFDSIGVKLKVLSELEKAGCGDIDRVSDSFAELLGELFASCPGIDDRTNRILYKMGYSLGRFIYILDACDDLEEDRKKKRYNPLLLADAKLTKEELYSSLMFTLSDIALSYELLDIKKNKAILDNIIYMGLADSLDSVFNKDKENTQNESDLADRKA